ncbi:hypothetical protein J4464_01365 [Candidatus Woesearchaeota archaeon]|nr:hypothetical protein [Candidatus Woesearchaeota archaeon]
MSEREILVDKRRMTYEGLFSVADLYSLIDEYFEEKGYDKHEKKNIERVTPNGKDIEIEVEPWKKITDYAQSIIRVRILMTGIKEVEVEKDGVKIKLNQGKVQLIFDAIFETDYEHRWEAKPVFHFVRTIVDRYLYKTYTNQYKGEVMNDFNMLVYQIKAFLNLYRH